MRLIFSLKKWRNNKGFNQLLFLKVVEFKLLKLLVNNSSSKQRKTELMLILTERQGKKDKPLLI